MPVKRNINQNWNDQMGGNYYGFGQGPNQGIASSSMNVEPELRKYFSDSNQMVYPGSLYSPHRGFEGMPTDGIMATDQAQKQKKSIFDFLPGKMILNAFTDKFKRPEDMQTAYEAITGSADDQGYGTYKGNKYKIEDNKIYSELFPGGKNFDSMFGSGSIEEMEMDPNKVGSVGWAQKRLQKGKNISQRLRDILTKRRIDKGGNWMDRPIGEGVQFKPDVPVGPIDTGQKPSYEGPAAVSFNPQQFAKAGRRASTPSGHTDPGKGSYGPWKADGGRIGYQGGELVTDESMMEATPAGFMQENVEEVQGEPSREQLEALAMEIFQLPLEELDEQQLMIVYQAAMQQEPMEEAVQEEDVQYASGGGRIGLRYGGLVSLL